MSRLWVRRIGTGTSLIGVGVLLSFGIFMTWIMLYPNDYDPKNIDYVLWTHGLNKNMNLDHAVGGMTHDVWPVRLVKGLDKDQLKNRFGYILRYDQATPYLQGCYKEIHTVGELGVHPNGREVVFLRDSAWMVIMDNGKAADLVLCKGY